MADDVYIDLLAPLDVRRMPNDRALIQQSAYKRFRLLLLERLKDLTDRRPADDAEEDDDEGTSLFIDRRHNTISIHGSRGTGKTTFVRNAFNLIKTDEALAGIAALGVVDPTLIESKENVFVVAINRVRDVVDRYYDRVKDRRDRTEEYVAWRKSLRELAGGLTLLDGISAEQPLGEGWDDKQYILQRGLDKARDATGLEIKFHRFIQHSLRFINRKVFLLAFDDVDTNFSRGWPVLEVIRRYLTSPCWLNVVCGDLDLFAMVVRGQQWANFEDKSLTHDRNVDAVRSMVDHLQGQYLLKVLRPENRITLQPLAVLAGQIRVGRGPEKDQPQGGQLLNETVDTLVRNELGFRGRWESRPVCELLLRQPVRSVLQVLSLSGGEIGTKSAGGEEFAWNLPTIFADSLLRHNISADELHDASSSRLLPRLARFLIDNRRERVAHSLFPDHQHDSLNLALLCIHTWVVREMARAPHLALDFMLRICLSYEVLSSQPDGLITAERHETEALREFARFAELRRLSGTASVTGRIIAVIAADSPQSLRPRFGIIPLYKPGAMENAEYVYRMYGVAAESPAFRDVVPSSLPIALQTFHRSIRDGHGTSEPGTYLGVWFNTSESLSTRIDATSAVVAALPFCEVIRGSAERAAFFSLYRLLAVMGRLIEMGAGGARPPKADIAYILRAESRTLAYPFPPWAKRPPPDQAETIRIERETMASADAGADDILESAMVGRLAAWVGRATQQTPPPPYVLTRAWSRFQMTLTNIDETLGPRRWSLGRLFHRYAVAFLNALLVEEALHRSQADFPTRNPVSDDAQFVRNLNRSAAHPFFDYVWTCPLWGAFLNPDTELYKLYLAATAFNDRAVWRVSYAIDPARRVDFDNLYPVLNSIPVIGMRRRSGSARRRAGKKIET